MYLFVIPQLNAPYGKHEGLGKHEQQHILSIQPSAKVCHVERRELGYIWFNVALGFVQPVSVYG